MRKVFIMTVVSDISGDCERKVSGEVVKLKRYESLHIEKKNL